MKLEKTTCKKHYRNQNLVEVSLTVRTKYTKDDNKKTIGHDFEFVPVEEGKSNEVRLKKHDIPNQYNDASYNDNTDDYNLTETRLQNIMFARKKATDVLNSRNLEWGGGKVLRAAEQNIAEQVGDNNE